MNQKVERVRELLSDLTLRDLHYTVAEILVDALSEAIAERLDIKSHVEGEGVLEWIRLSIGVKSPEVTA